MVAVDGRSKGRRESRRAGLRRGWNGIGARPEIRAFQRVSAIDLCVLMAIVPPLPLAGRFSGVAAGK